jgi:hypothetical protein
VRRWFVVAVTPQCLADSVLFVSSVSSGNSGCSACFATSARKRGRGPHASASEARFPLGEKPSSPRSDMPLFK